MGILNELAIKYNTDKQEKDHNYVKLYEQLLEGKRKNETTRVLEIGFGEGGSVKMWQDYFPNAEIHCIEYCDTEFKEQWKSPSLEVPNLKVTIGDSTIDETWANLPKDFDVIIDDGDHHPDSQIATFRHGIQHLKSGGLYFIEDTHCNFEQRYTEGVDVIYPWVFEMLMRQQTPSANWGGDFYKARPSIEGLAQDIYAYYFFKSVICFQKA
jgi:spermidine synthase